MTDKAKRVVETIKQACDVFAAMELPMAERECTLSYDAAMTLVKELEQVKRERDAYFESMKGMCATCKKAQFCILSPVSCVCWEWRGAKNNE